MNTHAFPLDDLTLFREGRPLKGLQVNDAKQR